MKRLNIIGGGMGSLELLTAKARHAMDLCEEIYAFDRMAQLFTLWQSKITSCSYSQLLPLLEHSKAQDIGVLVSGDTGFFSIAKLLKEKLVDTYEIMEYNGINSLQYLCSKLQLSYEKIPVISLHGRNNSLLGSIAYQKFTFVLTGGNHKATEILKELKQHGLGHIRVTAGEFLSMEQERIITGSVRELSEYSFDDLCVLLFDNERPVQKEIPLFDGELTRERTPMTKQEVRWASVNFLKLLPGDTVFDIGAGTGSVSIEMARRAHNGIVYAVEKEEEAYALLGCNKEKLGAYNVITKLGNAMEVLSQLPIPDKAFIGGSGKELDQILAYLFRVNPGIRLVVNAITLETLCSAMNLLKEHNCQVETICMNVARSKEAGSYHLMTANNPVYILAAEKKPEGNEI